MQSRLSRNSSNFTRLASKLRINLHGVLIHTIFMGNDYPADDMKDAWILVFTSVSRQIEGFYE